MTYYRTHLTAEDIRQIHEMAASREYLHREIAARFGVSRACIGRIINGLRHKRHQEHIDPMTVALAGIPRATQEALIRMSGLSLDHQAAELRLSRHQVKRYRSALIAANLLEPRKPRVRVFAPEQIDRVRRLASLGYSQVGIAQITELSETQIERICNRHGITTGSGFWSLSDIEQIMGVSYSAVDLWRANHWITPQPVKEITHRKGKQIRGIEHRVTRRDMTSFLLIRAAWPSYEPSNIADPELRKTAEMLRRNAHGRWVPLVEVADMACVHFTAIINRMKRSDWLTGWEWTTIGKSRYLWMPDGSVLPPYVERWKGRKRK